MRAIDSHSHPQSSQYDGDREEVLQRATEQDIGIICVGTDLEMSEKALELAHSHPQIWASAGLHPNDNLDEMYDQGLYEEMARDPKVVAIGEIGLDYYRTTEAGQQTIQKRRFVQQVEMASELTLPLIIHCRDPLRRAVGEASAHADMLKNLEFYRSSLRSEPGVIHSFTGTYEDAKQYIDLGFYIGLNGIITFSRDYDETVKNIPLEQILLETDAPYLTPEPYRGKRNEPSYVLHVAEKIAELRKAPLEEVLKKTIENTQQLFNLQ